MQDVAPSRSLSERSPAGPPSDLISLLSQKVLGQSNATKAIVPYVYMYQSGLAPAGRPAGVFLLLGPTGTGKIRTVEAIADLPVLSKPFLVDEVLNLIKAKYRRASSTAAVAR